jgi:hypothetical protein
MAYIAASAAAGILSAIPGTGIHVPAWCMSILVGAAGMEHSLAPLVTQISTGGAQTQTTPAQPETGGWEMNSKMNSNMIGALCMALLGSQFGNWLQGRLGPEKSALAGEVLSHVTPLIPAGNTTAFLSPFSQTLIQILNPQNLVHAPVSTGTQSSPEPAQAPAGLESIPAAPPPG